MTASETDGTHAFAFPASAPACDRELDITREVCPMTFVRVRLVLDRLAPGQVLRVLLRGAEPVANVPKTAQEQGHQILATEPLPDGVVALWLRRG